MRHSYHKLIFFVLPALIGGGCGPDKKQVIAEKVADRVADFRKKESAKCRESLLVTAESMVDSLLFQEALQEVNDSMKQKRPFKPLKPVAIPPIDSSGIKPIFDQGG